MKLILQAIKALFRKVENALEDVRKSIPEVAQPDWSQNDETKPDYVKNRTHYEEVKQESIVGLEFGVYGDKNFPIPFEIGQTWDLYYSANTNPSTATYSRYQHYADGGQPLSVKQADDGTLYIGDPNVNSYPFYVTETEFKGNSSWLSMYGVSLVKVVCVSGTKTVTKVKTLDEKFMPLDMVVELDVSGDEPVGKIISGTFEACKQKIENDIPARVKVIEKGVGYKAVECFEFVLMTQDSNEALWAYGFETEFVVLADGTVEFP